MAGPARRLRRCVHVVRRAAVLGVVASTLVTPAADARPSGRRPYRGLGVEAGLGNLSISQLAQTPDGLLWVGTEDGLYRFDGEEFERIGAAQGLLGDEIHVVLAAGDALWVGADLGVARLVGGRVVETSAGRGLPPGPAHAIALGPDGAAWVGTPNGLFRAVSARPGARFELAAGWPDGPCAAVWAGADGRVIAARGRELAVLDPPTPGTAPAPRPWRVLGAAAGFGVERIAAMATTGDGALWVRSVTRLTRCDRTATTCEDRSATLPDVSEIAALYVDRAGALWVPTRAGVSRLDPSGAWEHLGASSELPGGTVVAVLEDREGSLWLAADQLYQLFGRGLWRAHDTATGLPGSTVWAVVRDAAGALWLATSAGVFEAGASGWRGFPGTTEHAYQAIAAGPPGVLYAGRNPPAVARLDLAAGTTTLLGGADELSGADSIVQMLWHDGALWIGLERGGLVRMAEHGAAPAWSRVALPGGGPRDSVRQLVADRAGRLWAGGSVGLAVLERGAWRRYTTRDGLADDDLITLTVRASGEVCVAYLAPRGVDCFTRRPDGALAAARHLGTADGLPSDKVYTLGEDAAGRLYVGMGVGVEIVDGSQLEHVSSSTGLVGDDCVASVFLAEPDGRVLIGTSRGLAEFDGARYRGPLPPPASLITEVRIGDAVVPAGRVVRAPRPGTTSLEVRFATPRLAGRRQIEQQIRLLPLESAWRTSTRDEARYAQLPPGQYVFEVRAQASPGVFGPVARIEIQIAPAWWQTRWALGLGLALVGAALVAGVAWRVWIASRRAARRERMRADEAFRAALEGLPDPVLVLRGATLVHVNAKAAMALGHDAPAALLGRPLEALLQPDDLAAVTSWLADVRVAGRVTASREVRLLRADGAAVGFEFSSQPVEFDGAPAVLSIARDTTARKALEARLLMSDRLTSLGTLAAGVAHEINNPLAYIKANLDLLGEEFATAHGAASPAAATALADALDGTTRVQRIVGSLKAFSRVEREVRERVDVARALEAALRITSNELKHRARLVTQLGALPAVMGDESRLGQVFINLLVNAVHAIPDGDPARHAVTVVARTDHDGRAIVEVTDTGVGMSEQLQRRIFEPFFTTKDVGKGTGLGLSICLGIVRDMGGELEVDSAPGRGSTFRVVLPPALAADLGPGGRVRTVSVAPPHQATARRDILIVDDDDRLRDTLGRTLGKAHAVTLARSGRDALDRLEAGARFDVILSDLMMPEMTGMELHARLRELAPDQAGRMVFMTGGAFTAHAQAFLAGLDNPALEKPFELAVVRKLVLEIHPRAAPPTGEFAAVAAAPDPPAG